MLPRPDRGVQLSVATGIFDAGGNVLYLLAVRGDLLALVAHVQSLYPAARSGSHFRSTANGPNTSRLQVWAWPSRPSCSWRSANPSATIAFGSVEV